MAKDITDQVVVKALAKEIQFLRDKIDEIKELSRYAETMSINEYLAKTQEILKGI